MLTTHQRSRRNVHSLAQPTVETRGGVRPTSYLPLALPSRLEYLPATPSALPSQGTCTALTSQMTSSLPKEDGSGKGEGEAGISP